MASADTSLPAWEPVREPPAPPHCPAGQHTAPPDFVGVGVQRCGTTRWFDLIAAHPDVVTPPNIRKELHFFDRFQATGLSGPVDAYSAYFPRPPGRMAGEWTPTYLADVHTPRLLAAAAPAARVLVLVRDPVERFRSAVRRHQRVSARGGVPLHSLAVHDAFTRGLYHAQLARLTRHVDRSRVLLLQFERCVADPRGELDRTFSFLGLSPSRRAPDLGHWPNRQATQALPLGPARSGPGRGISQRRRGACGGLARDRPHALAVLRSSGAMTTVLLTGVPRGGTTLACELLNRLPDARALDEPLRAARLLQEAKRPRGGVDQEIVISAINSFAAQQRRSLLTRGMAVTKHVEGRVTGAKVSDDRDAEGRRRRLRSHGEVFLGVPSTREFTLALKHPVAFTVLVDACSPPFR